MSRSHLSARGQFNAKAFLILILIKCTVLLTIEPPFEVQAHCTIMCNLTGITVTVSTICTQHHVILIVFK